MRSKLHDTKFNYHFITAIFSQNQYVIDRVAGSLRNQKRITSHFVFETEMVRYRVKMVRFINRNDAIWNMNEAIYKRCDLEEKIV